MKTTARPLQTVEPSERRQYPQLPLAVVEPVRSCSRCRFWLFSGNPLKTECGRMHSVPSRETGAASCALNPSTLPSRRRWNPIPISNSLTRFWWCLLLRQARGAGKGVLSAEYARLRRCQARRQPRASPAAHARHGEGRRASCSDAQGRRSPPSPVCRAPSGCRRPPGAPCCGAARPTACWLAARTLRGPSPPAEGVRRRRRRPLRRCRRWTRSHGPDHACVVRDAVCAAFHARARSPFS